MTLVVMLEKEYGSGVKQWCTRGKPVARTSAQIRRDNSLAVIRAIHAGKVVSRKDLTDSTGLSFASVGTICSELLERGLLKEASVEKSLVGRPTTLLALNPSHGLLLGVDIAETYVHTVTFDTALEVLSSSYVPMDVDQDKPEQVLATANASIQEELDRHPNSRLCGIGVSVPGLVDASGHLSVFAPNWGWRNVPLFNQFQELFDTRICLDNPLKATAVAEIWQDVGRLEQSFIVLNLGTGVGAGIAIDGKVFRGRSNSAGEWGHTVIVADGRSCRCGANGCVEAYVGAPGIITTLQEIDPTNEILDLEDQTVILQELVKRIAAEDVTAQAALEKTGHYLGIGVANLVNLFNPEVVILAGWVSQTFGHVLIDSMNSSLKANALDAPMAEMGITTQASPGNSVPFGMATVALEKYLNQAEGLT